MSSPSKPAVRPRVVIVGAGFGGLSAARGLARVAVDITVVDRRNFHLFQPLLYQVATAALNPSDIAWPTRNLLGPQPNARVLLGEVVGVDSVERRVCLADGRLLPYDWLILATGATHTYFGRDDWATVAPGLKRIDDATLIRRRILMAFERAENLLLDGGSIERCQELMTFAVVGAGPTGVELVGAIAELAKKALACDFRGIDPRSARVVLVEGGNRVLPAFPPKLSDFAQRALERMGVEVLLNRKVTDCTAEGLIFDQEKLPAAVVLWAAGVAASPAARWLEVPADRAGRVFVAPDLSVPGHERVYVVGDTASLQQDGQPVPGVAPAAKQGGAYVAKQIRAVLAGRPSSTPFRYKNFGNLATIGRNAAVIHYGRLQIGGALAWWVWGFAHVFFLIGARNRVLVAIQWLYSYFTFSRGARLIVGSDAGDGPSSG